MQLCEYVFPVGFPLYVPKIGFWVVLKVKMLKYCVPTPEKHYPAWIPVCWCIACQNRLNGLSSRYKDFAYKERDKKLSGNFGYMGRSNPWGDLDQMWPVGRYGGLITCAIFRDCRLRGVGVVRAVSLPSPIDLTCRPYNTGHTTVWPCDLMLNNIVTLKSGLEVTQGHWNWCHLKAWTRLPIYLV